MEQFLRAVCADDPEWDTMLPMVEFAYNNQPHSSTRQSPFYLMYGIDPTVPIAPPVPCDVPRAHDIAQHLADIRAEAQKSLERVRLDTA